MRSKVREQGGRGGRGEGGELVGEGASLEEES